MLNPSHGISAFVDNLIIISAARYGASIGEEDASAASAQQQEKWQLVALAVQSVLRHPHSDDERLMLQHVEVSKFNADVCHHRAAYLLWKAKRAEANGPQRPSQFNITKDSLSREINLLYATVKQNLPSIQASADDSAIEEVHAFACKSEEDVRRDQKLAEAEDDFMRQVQELQADFYAKHKKWVDVPINLSPSKAMSASAAAAPALSAPPAGKASALEALDTAGVAQLLTQLDLAEHKDQFRRTTGKLLAQISKADLRERFGSDKEAADILWEYIERQRPKAEEKATPTRAAAAAPSVAKSAEAEQVEKLFAAFRSPDPFGSLKRAMHPDRPPRPSEQAQPDFELDEAEARAMEERYTRATRAQQHTVAPAAAAPAARSATTTSSSSSKPPQAAAASASAAPPAGSSQRANRWQVVEYDDDDEEDES